MLLGARDPRRAISLGKPKLLGNILSGLYDQIVLSEG
jgi:hypothetical protein